MSRPMGGAGGVVSDGKRDTDTPTGGVRVAPDWLVAPSLSSGMVTPTSGTKKHVPLTRGSKDGAKNSYGDVDAAVFSLRGKTYLEDHVKVPSAPAAFRLAGAQAFKSNKPLHRSGDVVPELREYLEANPDNHFLVVAWLLPGSPTHTVIQVFVREAGPDPVFDPLYQRFLDSDDEFRNDHFKFCFKIVSAPWLVTTAVSNLGGERPTILGKKLTTSYHRGANFLEIDVDVGSSKIASMVNGIIVRGASGIVMDLGFVLEGQAEDELPERMMACLRFLNCDINLAAIDKTSIL